MSIETREALQKLVALLLDEAVLYSPMEQKLYELDLELRNP